MSVVESLVSSLANPNRPRVDLWVDAVLSYHRPGDPWMRAERYDLVPTSAGLVIRRSGSLVEVDMETTDVLSAFGSWGTPALPANQAGLLRLVHRVGLTDPWTYPDPYDVAQPPLEQEVRRLKQDVEVIKRAVECYRAGVEPRLAGMVGSSHRRARDAATEFQQLIADFGNKVLAIVRWGPSYLEHLDEFAVVQRFTCRRPPSLFEYAMADVLAMFQSQSPVRRCELSECRAIFRHQPPRGNGPKKWSRADARYCSQRHAQRASRLRQRERHRESPEQA